ncbi:hypothetical protein BZL29_8512 [Mycobacterium kansasii]|uniref:Uncharacterized protein n=1 Tax=Mycobacterium kansasii TaxID=1768 RepID=A0A1V3WB48_MYCKA|nr:hypothetical protein BZL29_8512 [Mycobacterium kansasii]
MSASGDRARLDDRSEAVVADLTEQFAQRRDLAANSISREAAPNC